MKYVVSNATGVKLQGADISLDAARDINLQAAVNTLSLQEAAKLKAEQQKQAENAQAAKLVGEVVTNAIGDLAQKQKWAEGSPEKTALHGLAGLIQAKIGGTGALAGLAAGMANEQMLPLMVAYLESHGVPRMVPSKDPNKPGVMEANPEFSEMLKAGSALVGVAAEALGSAVAGKGGNLRRDAGAGGNLAVNATENNYLKHPELDKKKAEIAACGKDKVCVEERTQYWNTVSQDRNAQVQDSCTNGTNDQCRANMKELATDLAELTKYGSGTGAAKFTPEESNNIKQVVEKYKINLETVADRANTDLNQTYNSPNELFLKGYLTKQEAEDLKSFRAGTMIHTLGAVILPGGVRLASGSKVKSAAQVADEARPSSAKGNAALEVEKKVSTDTSSKPDFVFRGDDRLPSAIFNEGFAPRGNNLDLQSHVTTNQNSGYVPTSTSPTVAREFAEYQSGGFVYVIKKPSNGVDVNATLGNRSPIPSELEIAVPGRINPQDIIGARPVGSNGKYSGPFVKNPNYKP